MPCASFSILDGPGGTPGSEKFLLNEVNLITQYIIVQDPDDKNN
jgi:hypothetical protein